MKILLGLVFGLVAFGQEKADPVYAPLWLYNGSWQVSPKTLKAGEKPDQLTNVCSLTGKFFACQQTVNGKIGALVIFIPDKPGHYFTQAVMVDGLAGGRGELTIDGPHWVYSSKAQEDGKVTYYRTTNEFTGKDNIHFESAQSADEKEWKVNLSGDEVRKKP